MEQIEVMMTLDELSRTLSKSIEDLKKRKDELGEIVKLIKKIDDAEKTFSEIFSESNNLGERLLAYFEGVDAYKKQLLPLREQLKAIELEISERERSIRNNLKNEAFTIMALNTYHNQLISFLNNKKEDVEKIRNRYRSIFDEAKNEIEERIKVMRRLIVALTRKIDETPRKHSLKVFLDEKQSLLQKIMTDLPSKSDDLLKRKPTDLSMLHKLILEKIHSCRSDLINFAIGNGLLEKNEIAVLEAIYGMKRREFDFNEIVELLKGREILSKSYEEIQTILLSLSRKGFLTLKVLLETKDVASENNL